MDEALAALDRVIDMLEETQRDARRVLIDAPEGDRRALEAALRGLDAKLDEARRKRLDVAERLERAARRRVLMEELRGLKDELEAMTDEERRGPRAVAIRDRVTEIRLEAAAIARAGAGPA